MSICINVVMKVMRSFIPSFLEFLGDNVGVFDHSVVLSFSE